jgi:hypothetical protein
VNGLTLTVAVADCSRCEEAVPHYHVAEFDGDLRELQAAVGGYIEPIPTADDVTMWVNEEGKLQRLPVNRLAMDVWIRWDVYGCMTAGADWIAGNCVITGGTTPSGNTRSLSEAARRWVLRVVHDAGLEVTP